MYKQLVSLYHFNPVDDVSMFKNMEYQCFYTKSKNEVRVPNMKFYVYLYGVPYSQVIKRKQNEIYKVIIPDKQMRSFGDNNNKLIAVKVPEGVNRIPVNYYEWSDISSITLPSTLRRVHCHACKSKRSTYQKE